MMSYPKFLSSRPKSVYPDAQIRRPDTRCRIKNETIVQYYGVIISAQIREQVAYQENGRCLWYLWLAALATHLWESLTLRLGH